MSETDGKAREGVIEEPVAETPEGDDQTRGGTGGSLFKRVSSRVPTGRRARVLTFVGGGAVLALLAGVFGAREWRKHR